MKTIFSYIAKCLLTYTLSFALLQVQVFLPIENLRYASGNAMAASDGVSKDENGVATKSGTVTLKNKKSNFLLDHLAMISMGFITFKTVSACQPRPMDVILAGAGGVIYIGAELYSFNAFKDLKAEDKIAYTSKEDGENDTQIEMLQAQKKGYEDIAKTAKMKSTIQLAAATAYGAAAVVALLKSQQWRVSASTCTAACTQAAGVAEEAVKNTPGIPSTIKAADLYAACAAKQSAVAIASSNPVTGAACTAAASTCAIDASMCATEVAICKPGAFSVLDMLGDTGGESVDALQKFAQEGLKLPGIGQILNDEFMANVVKETYVLELQNKLNIPNYIDKANPFFDLNKKMEFDETNFETQVNSYARNRDMSRFFQGELASTSVESFNNFKNSLYEIELNSDSSSLSDNLKLAINNGIDLIVPSANANSMSVMLGGAIGIFIGINKLNVTWVDTMIATPGYRSMVWTAAAGLAFTASSSSKKIQESAEGNATKIQKIIDKLSQQGVKTASSLGGSQLSIPSQIPYSIKGNAALSLGTAAVPCADKDGTNGCGSLQSGIESSTSFASLGGSFGTLAGTAGAAADGITGSNTIPSSAVDGLVELSNNNNAIKKKLDEVQRKFNKALEDQGKPALDFDKLNDNILAKLRKNTNAVLSGSGKSAADVLAAIGPVGSDDSEEKKVAAAAPAESSKLKMTAGKSKKVNGGFRLDLENEGSNDGLNADEVLANQKAANAINGEAQDDIVANKDVSIFKVISVRYLKSGFNKLLEEDK